MASNLKFYKGKYNDFYNKFLTEDKSEIIDSNALYFTTPDDKPNDNDVLSSSYGIWLGDKLISSSYVANDRGNLTNVEIVDGKPLKDDEGNVTGTTAGQFLKYTYQLSDESTQEVYFEVSDLLVDSEFKTGLTVSGGVVSVKVASAQTQAVSATKASNKNFLTVDNNGLAVKSINTDSTILENDITIAGLSDSGLGELANGDILSAGTSVYDILQKMLCKEIYPTPGYKQASANVGINTPTITLSKTGVMTYGTKISVSGAVSTISSTTTNNEVNNLENGYKLELTGNTVDSKKITKTTSINLKPSSELTTNEQDYYKIVLEYDGFRTESDSTSVTATTSGDCVAIFTDLEVGMGSNVVYVTSESPTYIATCEAITSGYVVSNLGKVSSTKTFSGKTAYTKSFTPTKTGDTTVTGVLPCFANVSNGALVDTPAQLSLITSKDFTITVPSEVVAKKHFMFDFPADRTVSSFKVKDLQGNFVAFEAAYSQSTEVEKTINGLTMKYKRLTTTGDYVGDGVYKITLSTDLNSADMTKVLKNNN